MFYKKKEGYLYDSGLEALAMFIVLCLVAGYVLDWFGNIFTNFWLKQGNGIIMVLLIIGIGVFIYAGMKNIPKGYKGLVIYMGKRTNQVVDEGWNWRIPLIYEIEEVDCTEKDIHDQFIKVTLNNHIPVDIKVTLAYRIISPYKYFDNYDKSKGNFDKKVIAEVTSAIREHLAKGKVNEIDIVYIRNAQFNGKQIDLINKHYLDRRGLKLTTIKIDYIGLEPRMQGFYGFLRQADLLHQRGGISYEKAIKQILIREGKYQSGEFSYNSDSLVQALGQLRKVQALSTNFN